MAKGKAKVKETGTEVIVAPQTSTAVAIPSAIPRGFEQEDTKDLLLPRVELLQSNSPAVADGKAKAGELVNQISKSPLPTNLFIPIAMQRKYIKWIPRAEGGGIEYQTSNPEDARVIEDIKWGPHGEKPKCTAYMNFLILLEGSTLPIVLSFSMTNYQEGRKLYTMAKMANCDMWLRRYKLGARSRENAMGRWFSFDVSEAGNPNERDSKVAEVLYTAFATRDLSFEVEAEATTPAPKGEDF